MEDELPAELEQQGQRDEAGRRFSHLQQVADQRRAELQQRFGTRSSSCGSLTGRCTWHSASSRTCAKIRQRRQHQGHRRMKLQDNVRAVVVRRSSCATRSPGPYGCGALLLPRQPQDQ